MATTSFIIGDNATEVVEGSTPLQVQVTITEIDTNADNTLDSLEVTLDVVNGSAADLRGFFFNVPTDNLGILSNLAVTGTDVTGQEYDTDGDLTPELSDAAPPEPEATIEPLAFFAGVEIGTQGMGGDDISSTTFVIRSIDATPLTLALLEGQDIGIRATSVGEYREGSSKLTGEVPPPSNPDPDPDPDPDPSVSFDKDIDILVDFDFTSDVDINFDKDVNIDVSVDSDVDIEDNVAMLTFSVEAFGENTLADADVHVLATDDLSSVDGVLISAVS